MSERRSRFWLWFWIVLLFLLLGHDDVVTSFQVQDLQRRVGQLESQQVKR